MIQATEHQIQNAIMGYLRAKGYYVMRLNSGAIRSRDGHGKMNLIRLMEPGTPDVLAFKGRPAYSITPNGEPSYQSNIIFVEVKAGKNKPTTLQKMKMDELMRYGATCFVAYSVEDLIKLGI